MSLRADLEIIQQWIRPGSRVLDLGCGEGQLLRHLRDHKQLGSIADHERRARELRERAAALEGACAAPDREVRIVSAAAGARDPRVEP